MMKRPIALVGLLSAWCFAACGCYNAQEVRAFLQEPRSPVSGVEYRVYPPDVISIASIHVSEIDRIMQQVRPDGRINVPLVGEVFVAGKTPRQIEEALNKLAREYYEQVDATVQIVGYNSQRFYVLGQVSRPGPMPWTGRDTLLDALAKAQPNDMAWSRRIIVIRGDEPQVGGHCGPTTRPAATTMPAPTTAPATEPSPTTPLADKIQAVYGDVKYRATGVHAATKDRPRRKMTVNLLAMIRSGDMSHNILLMPNDVIYVQPDPLARVGLAIQTILFPVRAMTDGLSDYRALTNDYRWIEDGMLDEAQTRGTLIAR